MGLLASVEASTLVAGSAVAALVAFACGWGLASGLGWGAFHAAPGLRQVFRRTRWNVTAVLHSNDHVSRPAVFRSREVDMTRAVMNAISAVHSIGDQEQEIAVEVFKQLDGNEVYKSVNINLSDSLQVRVDIIRTGASL